MTNTTSNTVTAQDHNPILFIHGWDSNIVDWNVMITRFKNGGWSNTSLFAYNFNDPGNCSDQANINNANQIKQWVEDILETTGANKLDLVAHSMGGLSSRYYMKFLTDLDSINNYVSLGSPHHGKNGAPACGFSFDTPNDLLILLNEGDETPGGVLNDTLGDRIDPYLEITYNGTHIPGSISYTSIFSRDDNMVTPYNTSRLEGAINIIVSGLDHMGLITSPSGYELVKEAVDDPYVTTTTTTTATTTTTITTDTVNSTPETSSWFLSPLLMFVIFIVWIKRTKKVD